MAQNRRWLLIHSCTVRVLNPSLEYEEMYLGCTCAWPDFVAGKFAPARARYLSSSKCVYAAANIKQGRVSTACLVAVGCVNGVPKHKAKPHTFDCNSIALLNRIPTIEPLLLALPCTPSMQYPVQYLLRHSCACHLVMYDDIPLHWLDLGAQQNRFV